MMLQRIPTWCWALLLLLAIAVDMLRAARRWHRLSGPKKKDSRVR